MEKQRAMERLIFFTDAVVAIAITLLILPLVEIVTSYGAEHRSVESFLRDNVSQMFAFALSFAVIARLWMAHHEILENAVRASTVLIWLDLAWVFTVVIIPLPTEITAAFSGGQLAVLIYVGVAAVNTLFLFALAYYLFRHPEMQSAPTSLVQIWGVGSNTVGFLLAFVLALLFPALSYYVLLTPALTIPLDRIVKPRIARREAARATQ